MRQTMEQRNIMDVANKVAIVSGASPLNLIAIPADVADSIIFVITGIDVMTAQIITIDGGGYTIN